MKNHTKFKDINENIRFLRCTRRCGSLFSETQIHADFRRLFSFAPLFSFKSTGKRPIFCTFAPRKRMRGTLIHANIPHVGAYRIRPNTSTNPRGCFQGVCNTPLHEYSKTKLVCEKMEWNTETQRHRALFLREQSSQSKSLALWSLPSLYIYFSVPLCLCVQYKGLTDLSQSISD